MAAVALRVWLVLSCRPVNRRLQPCSIPNRESPQAVEHIETSDNYDDVVVAINATTRLINCKDDLQWILQARTGNRWRSKSYWLRRDPLIERLTKTTLSPIAEATLRALPERHQ